MKSRFINTTLCIIFTVFVGFSQETTTNFNTTGPKNGSLVIVGGGKSVKNITAKFIELAGGKDANIVVIPTAGGRSSYDQNSGGANNFRNLGAINVKVIHAGDKETANSEEFLQNLQNADGIWFSGGRQWRLVDSYKNTKSEKAFQSVLDKGGVIGGSSAGATIQGSYLARGDTKNNQIMMGDHEEGFGYIKNIAIDQHVIARNRHFDMFDILDNRPELLGISIDESTAIVVSGNEFKVIGNSYVIIFDSSFWSREGSQLKTLPKPKRQFYFLKEGDRYDLKNRRVIDKR